MSWFDAYRAYDDDTLTALANAGLLRRAAKDVASDKVGWIEHDAEQGVIGADGQQVRLDGRGPQYARCDCPAPGMCKHILSAALWLRELPVTGLGVEAAHVDTLASVNATASSDASSPTTPHAPPEPSAPLAAMPDPLAEILALKTPALFKAAGAAAMRRAAATPVGRVEWRRQGGVLVIELPDLGQNCRWVAGSDFAGMISEAPAAERKAIHLMALIALRQAHGLSDDWPANVKPVPTPATNATLTARERAFLTQVDAMLAELLTGGLSHVSELTSAQLLALNMSARGEGLPRLAALLRNLGGTVDLLARHDHRADERDALAVMARIHALCAALAGVDGDLALVLRGQTRRDFDASHALELLPLGAHWWQTRGGARGLTLAFWDIPNARLLQATLARPDGSDTAFTRPAAWATHAFWSGAGSAQRICETAWRLEQPRLADDGRIALGGVTRAFSQARWTADDPRLQTLGIGDWTELSERLRAATGLVGEPLDAVLLRPANASAPHLDEASQCLDWAVQDTQGNWLALTIPITPEHQQRVDSLDRLHDRRVKVLAVLTRIERASAQTRLIPVAVLSRGDNNTLQILSLDFDSDPKPARATSLANRILRLLEARRETPPAIAEPTLTDRLLAPLFDLLETQAATGRLQLTAAQAERFDHARALIASVGLDTLAQALDAYRQHPNPAGMLRLYRLCELLAEMDGLPGGC